jgi:hypothetical protein
MSAYNDELGGAAGPAITDSGTPGREDEREHRTPQGTQGTQPAFTPAPALPPRWLAAIERALPCKPDCGARRPPLTECLEGGRLMRAAEHRRLLDPHDSDCPARQRPPLARELAPLLAELAGRRAAAGGDRHYLARGERALREESN